MISVSWPRARINPILKTSSHLLSNQEYVSIKKTCHLDLKGPAELYFTMRFGDQPIDLSYLECLNRWKQLDCQRCHVMVIIHWSLTHHTNRTTLAIAWVSNFWKRLNFYHAESKNTCAFG